MTYSLSFLCRIAAVVSVIFFFSLVPSIASAEFCLDCEPGGGGGGSNDVYASISATPTSVPLGSSTVISWSSGNATSCSGSGFSTGNATSGSQTITPGTTGLFTYTVTCQGTNGPAVKSVVVDVYNPMTVSCNPSPTAITKGNSSLWDSSVSGGTGSYTYSWSGTDGLSGSSNSVSKTYTSTGTKYGGVTVNSGTQTVNKGCTSTVVVSENPPTASISASPTTVTPGQQTTITWSSTNASSCTGSGFSTGDATSGSIVVTPSVTSAYGVTCTGLVTNPDGYWTQVNSGYTKVCSANSDPNDESTSIQQPFCEDYDAGGISEGSSCSGTDAGVRCKEHGWQGIGACSGQGTVYGLVITYECQSGGGPQNASDTVTVIYDAPECSDGLDNDGDNDIDYPADVSCSSASEDDESGPPPAQCSNGIDDDGDGLIDTADYGCTSGSDTTEAPNPECSDGYDNNSNGLTDYTEDPSCTGPTDDSEQALPVSLTLTAPQFVQRNTSVSLVWSGTNVLAGSCSLSGTNGDSWDFAGVSGTQNSTPLNQGTIFTLACEDYDSVPVATSVTVRLVPSFEEI